MYGNQTREAHVGERKGPNRHINPVCGSGKKHRKKKDDLCTSIIFIVRQFVIADA